MTRLTRKLEGMTLSELEEMRLDIEGGYHYPGKESDIDELKLEQLSRMPRSAKDRLLSRGPGPGSDTLSR